LHNCANTLYLEELLRFVVMTLSTDSRDCMQLVLVESPTKVKSIERHLGPGFTVLATYGHVRDLPSRPGSVNPENDFEFTWENIARNTKHLQAISQAAKKASKLILATDRDREGEAIAWHVLEYLKGKGALKVPVERITFNAITKSAVQAALADPKDVNLSLVNSYLARLGLDYLVGFTVSPVLWRKLPGSRSAGRVQSVALRLVCDREAAIETFKPQEYWTVEGLFQREEEGPQLSAQLRMLEGKKLDKFSLASAGDAQQAVTLATGNPYTVSDVAQKSLQRNPTAPFITSTLQQEASRKLGFSPAHTMRLAQQLYEGVSVGGETLGLISYMRTDSTAMAPEAIQECRAVARDLFGAEYVAEKPRTYVKKVRGAQEAHEAIRPTQFSQTPDKLSGLSKELLALYTLIWKRAVASQMANAVFDQLTVSLSHPDNRAVFKVTGTTCRFMGFRKVYEVSTDEEDAQEAQISALLASLNVGTPITLASTTPAQHHTQPPPRYTEASLIKEMEELGIGRPSTYARVLQVLRERDYVNLEKKQLRPQERGQLVTSFLRLFLKRYVEYNFTADLEDQLDRVAEGELTWKELLSGFWKDLKASTDGLSDVKITEVLNAVSQDLDHHIFLSRSRSCPECKEGTLELRLGKFGPFLGCVRYPECKTIISLTGTGGEQTQDASLNEQFPKVLGKDPSDDQEISLRLGPYGPYLQWGNDKKPKRVSVPKEIVLSTITLADALKFGQLPCSLGVHPDTQKEITGGIGRFGPYVKHDGVFTSVKDISIVLDKKLDLALACIAKKRTKRKA
jgi:DNA topoisomerase-1